VNTAPGLLVLPANIRLGWKCFNRIRHSSLVGNVSSELIIHITFIPVFCHIKHFTVEIISAVQLACVF